MTNNYYKLYLHTKFTLFLFVEIFLKRIIESNEDHQNWYANKHVHSNEFNLRTADWFEV